MSITAILVFVLLANPRFPVVAFHNGISNETGFRISNRVSRLPQVVRKLDNEDRSPQVIRIFSMPTVYLPLLSSFSDFILCWTFQCVGAGPVV